MRHLLIIKKDSANLACGPRIEAYYPMDNMALDPSGIGRIDVCLNPENTDCPRCIRAARGEKE